jgi:hypothetical protein
MSPDRDLIFQAVRRLEQELGEVDLSSEPFAFDCTDYYQAEMGPGLVKQFFSFSLLRPPEFLFRLKRRTAACERTHRSPLGGRLVNLDPGYWSDAKLVLASTKNYSHRIPLGRRVYAEVTLRVNRGRLEPLDWTYRDYRSPLALDFFSRVRSTYFDQLSKIKI